MQQLTLALLAATSVSDVSAAVSREVPKALGIAGGARLLGMIDDHVDQPGRHDASSRQIVLRAGSRVLAALVIEDHPDHSMDDRVQTLAEMVLAALTRIHEVEAQQSRALKEAAELRFDVVSMLSHEMRTPLTSIKGYASALLLEGADWDASATMEFLQSIEAEADHLTKLVADILEATAIEAGDLRLDLEPVLMSQIAKRVIDKVAIQGDGHRFVLMFPPDFPVVEADAHRVEQVLTNLVENAVKYSPDGGMVLVRGEYTPGEVTVSVVDQGMGIAPEHLNKLFERFFRAVPDHRKRIVGTGLGLPIADAIVRAHGGRIWASSVVGSGTTLSFSLPHPRVSTGSVR